MRVQPHPGAGVELLDVDLRTLDDPTFEAIRTQFAIHGLVFFRDQQLTPADHLAFARRLGPVNVNRFFPHRDDHPEIAQVVKEPDQRVVVGGGWHTDHAYDVEPALGSVLVARTLPPTGGDTCFVHMADAFDRLSPGLQDQLYALEAVHSSKYVFGSRGRWIRRLVGADALFKNADQSDDLDDVVHPVVIRHPLSGRACLYVNPGFTLRIAGWSLLRSALLLARLYRNTLQERHIARFQWRPGSVALWDNRATWHLANNDYPGHRRVMDRVTVEGVSLTAARAPEVA